MVDLDLSMVVEQLREGGLEGGSSLVLPVIWSATCPSEPEAVSRTEPRSEPGLGVDLLTSLQESNIGCLGSIVARADP